MDRHLPVSEHHQLLISNLATINRLMESRVCEGTPSTGSSIDWREAIRRLCGSTLVAWRILDTSRPTWQLCIFRL